MKVIDTSGLNRQQRLALRSKSIGASDAPTVAGINHYQSRFGLWLLKTGRAEPEEAGEEAWWGLQMEELIERRLEHEEAE